MRNLSTTKKLLALLLVLMLAVTTVACNGNTPASTPPASGGDAPSAADSTPKEVVTITMYGPTSGGNSGVQTSDIFNAIKDRIGVQVDIDFVYSEDKFESMMASNSLPDIMYYPGADVKRFIESGLFLPMDDLLETNGQNILKYAPMTVEYSRQYQSADTGKVYFLNHQTSSNSQAIAGCHVGPNIRWDYYKGIGAPELNSDEDFVDAVAAILEKYPENEDGLKNVGISLWADWGKWTPFCWGAYALNLNETYYPYTMRKSDSEIIDTYGPDGQFRYGMEFLNYAYRMGVLDPDSFTQGIGDVQAKAGTAQIVATVLEVAAEGTKYLEGKGLEKMGYSTQSAPIVINGSKNAFYYYTPAGRDPQWMISANAENPEACMDFLNLLYDPEFFELVINGQKGQEWDVDADGNRFFNEIYYERIKEPGIDVFDKYGYSGLMGSWSFEGSDTNPLSGKPYTITLEDPKFYEQALTSVEKDILEYYGFPLDPNGYRKSLFEDIPLDKSTLAWNAAQATITGTIPEDLKLIDTNINLYLDKEYVKLAMCESEEAFEAEWTAMLAELENLGIQQIRDFIKPIYEKAIADAAALES